MLYSFEVNRAEGVVIGGVVADSAEQAFERAQQALGGIAAVTVKPWASGLFFFVVPDQKPEKTKER